MWDFLHNHSGSCFLTLSQPSLGFLGLWLVGIITYIVRERHAFCFHVYWHCIHTYIVHTYIHSTSYGIRMLAPKLLAPSSKWRRKQNSGSSWVVRREGGWIGGFGPVVWMGLFVNRLAAGSTHPFDGWPRWQCQLLLLGRQKIKWPAYFLSLSRYICADCGYGFLVCIGTGGKWIKLIGKVKVQICDWDIGFWWDWLLGGKQMEWVSYICLCCD